MKPKMKKKLIGMSLSPELIEELDGYRRMVPRSALVEAWLWADLKRHHVIVDDMDVVK